MNLKERLKDKLTREELEKAPRSFEIIGDIAIIKIPDELSDKKQVIGQTLMNQHKRLKTVLNKTEKRTGEFRTADYEIIKGEETETIHKEHGCRYKLDPTDVYFSERLGTERERVIDQVKSEEIIHAMFAGIGPYPIMAARNKDPKKIYAVEKNPEAYNYLKENIKLNKVSDKVEAYQGDVRKIMPKIDQEADRTIMPLPKTGENFLDLAFNYTKKGGIIHYYEFEREENLWDKPINKIKDYAKKNNLDLKVKGKEKCGHYAPYVHRICLDLKLKDKTQ